MNASVSVALNRASSSQSWLHVIKVVRIVHRVSSALVWYSCVSLGFVFILCIGPHPPPPGHGFGKEGKREGREERVEGKGKGTRKGTGKGRGKGKGKGTGMGKGKGKEKGKGQRGQRGQRGWEDLKKRQIKKENDFVGCARRPGSLREAGRYAVHTGSERSEVGG